MEKTFYKDIANWCVTECNLIGDGIINQLEIDDYDLKEYPSSLKDKTIMIACPDHPSLIAVKYAVKHSKLSDKIKSIVKYQVDDRFPYVVGFDTFDGSIDEILKEFIEDKPWVDSQKRDFECFCVRKPVQVAKVVAYNDYLKKNNTMLLRRQKLYDGSTYSYKFKGVDGSPQMFFSLDEIDDQEALDHCLDFLKYRTCLKPITITKYEFQNKEQKNMTEEKAVRKFEVVSKYKDQGITLPKRSTKGSAGYDICACETVEIPPFEYLNFFKRLGKELFGKKADVTDKPILVHTGIKAKMPKDEYLSINNRSSNPLKRGLWLANGVGVIDSDYYNNADNEGEICGIFVNFSNETYTIHKGDKIMQGIFQKYEITNDDEAQSERSGGFGSTGD